MNLVDLDKESIHHAGSELAEAEILRQANAVVAGYIDKRLAEAIRRKEICGCRACATAGDRWLAWARTGGEPQEPVRSYLPRWRDPNPGASRMDC